MSYPGTIQNVLLSDKKGNLDAFSRLRVSSSSTRFDSKLLHGKEPLIWGEKLVGGGAITYVANESGLDLSVTTASGDKAISQSNMRVNYIPGNSLLVLITGNFNSSQSNNTKRTGYFDDKNGLFFQLKDTVLSVCKRSSVSGSPVDTVVTQANWNIDKLDGTGASGITLDITKTQIFIIDFQWLGSGFVRFGFDIDGKIIYVHELNHSNIESTLYMNNSNLPIRYENENTGAIASVETFRQQCSTVILEGNTDGTIVPGHVDNGITLKSTDDALIPLIGIRLKSTRENASVQITKGDIVSTSGANARWDLQLNPTVSGTPVWVDVPNSSLQVDVAATGIAVDGYHVAGGYFTSNSDRGSFENIESILHPYIDVNGVSGEFYLCIQNVAVQSESFLGAFDYRELR